MRIKNIACTAAIAMLAAVVSPVAANAADLLSGSVQVESAYPDINTIDPSYTVSGPTTGTINTLYGWYFTFTSNTITWYNPYPGQRPAVDFNGWLLNFSGIPEIANVTIDPLSPLNGSSVGFTQNSVSINTSGVYLPAGNEVFDVTFASATVAVPEPATWAMMLLGFGMVGYGMRRRANVRTTVSYA